MILFLRLLNVIEKAENEISFLKYVSLSNLRTRVLNNLFSIPTFLIFTKCFFMTLNYVLEVYSTLNVIFLNLNTRTNSASELFFRKSFNNHSVFHRVRSHHQNEPQKSFNSGGYFCDLN